MMRYELYYWPTIQGRGEFVRLALEDASADYVDVARRSERGGKGVPALMRVMEDAEIKHVPFVPPFLKAGDLIIGQTANILLFLGPRLSLVPEEEAARLWAHQLQLTIADLVTEAHDTHHPVSVNLFYKEQKPEAQRRAADFVAERLPKFLGYFEGVLERNPHDDQYTVGDAHSYIDLSLFQVMEGLRYAFPRAMRRLETDFPHLVALHHRVLHRRRIAAYLTSERRLPFSKDDVFRHYPELDA
jgi:glutathione S-transferase